MWRVLVFSVAFLTATTRAGWSNEIAVDLQLVLAVDASASMTESEQQLQRQGYVAAFQSSHVLEAIHSGPLGRIAVAYVEWGDPDRQAIILPWTMVDSRASAISVAKKLADAPVNRFFSTSIAEAIRFSGGMFHNSGFAGERQVIDISGDGPNNVGSPVAAARDTVVEQGVTINGLPIMIHLTWDNGLYSIEGLDFYYQDCVIGGSGAFVVSVNRPADFAAAITRKLTLEISGPNRARAQPIAFIDRPQHMDCLAGEKNTGRLLPLKPKKPLSE